MLQLERPVETAAGGRAARASAAFRLWGEACEAAIAFKPDAPTCSREEAGARLRDVGVRLRELEESADALASLEDMANRWSLWGLTTLEWLADYKWLADTEASYRRAG